MGSKEFDQAMKDMRDKLAALDDEDTPDVDTGTTIIGTNTGSVITAHTITGGIRYNA